MNVSPAAGRQGTVLFPKWPPDSAIPPFSFNAAAEITTTSGGNNENSNDGDNDDDHHSANDSCDKNSGDDITDSNTKEIMIRE